MQEKLEQVDSKIEEKFNQIESKLQSPKMQKDTRNSQNQYKKADLDLHKNPKGFSDSSSIHPLPPKMPNMMPINGMGFMGEVRLPPIPGMMIMQPMMGMNPEMMSQGAPRLTTLQSNYQELKRKILKDKDRFMKKNPGLVKKVVAGFLVRGLEEIGVINSRCVAAHILAKQDIDSLQSTRKQRRAKEKAATMDVSKFR